jgi:glucose-1-phosphate adenylyltransferase
VDVGTIEAYWQAHMDLLVDKPRLDLLDRDWVIHTRSEERPPASIRNSSSIERSLITNGCVIEGTVKHSILSPGVRVRPGAIVQHSVLMTDSVIEENAIVGHAILDKRVHVGAGARIGWADNQVSCTSTDLDHRITVIGKNTLIPPHTRIGCNCTIAADLPEGAFEADLIPDQTAIGVIID